MNAVCQQCSGMPGDTADDFGHRQHHIDQHPPQGDVAGLLFALFESVFHVGFHRLGKPRILAPSATRCYGAVKAKMRNHV